MSNTPSLSVGDPAPDFAAETDGDSPISLAELHGRAFVLYFYPKDDTPGCTAEACDFRDQQPAFADKDTMILGVSPDSVARHRKFRDKYNLNFRLLADPEHVIAEAWGVWREKKNYGKTYMGIVRATFVVDATGTITAIYDNVRVKGHAAKVLAELG